jgi:NADPH-dependent 2,4-dienoyl-CoA reductase/sulfur reductase-like enzyme
MSAALAASSNPDICVTVVDDNPHLGGQIWRAELGNTKATEALKCLEAIESGRTNIINNAQIFGRCGDHCLAAETSDGRVNFEYQKLILATGARERFLPFPGWTLPNVLGAGGLQALVKGGLNIEGKRVVVAGTGPLLLAVADYLNAKGAKVIVIAEQASAAKVRRFARGLWRRPSKMMEAAALRARLVGIKYSTDSWVVLAEGDQQLEQIALVSKGKTRTVSCDYLACGFHLVPNTELAEVLGCRFENGCVDVDEFQQTTVESVFCAGEPTGIAGIESSLVEGTIAGLAASGQLDTARSHFEARDKARRFGNALNAAFALRTELKKLADDDTIVCRCEDVRYGRLTEFNDSRDAKLQTRCGMGACQGRVCGPATEFLFGWKSGSVRPPIFPVRLENL